MMKSPSDERACHACRAPFTRSGALGWHIVAIAEILDVHQHQAGGVQLAGVPRSQVSYLFCPAHWPIIEWTPSKANEIPG
jgi:hypothetical protein